MYSAGSYKTYAVVVRQQRAFVYDAATGMPQSTVGWNVVAAQVNGHIVQVTTTNGSVQTFDAGTGMPLQTISGGSYQPSYQPGQGAGYGPFGTGGPVPSESPNDNAGGEGDLKGCLTMLCIAVGLVVFLSPGIFVDWWRGRLAANMKYCPVYPFAYIQTWGWSLLFWVPIAGLFAWIGRLKHAELRTQRAEEDAEQAEAAYQDAASAICAQSEPPASPPAVEEPEAEDSVESLCTDKACGRALGLSGQVTMDDVREAYRQQIAGYHPDKVAHLGSKLRALAEQESTRLNVAYQYFEEKYGSAS